MRKKQSYNMTCKRKSSRIRGFSLMEVIIAITIVAVLAAVITPSLVSYVEDSRSKKDVAALNEVTNAIKLSVSNVDVYEEIYQHSQYNNVSCYIDQSSEDGLQPIITSDPSESYKQYMFGDDAREANGSPYYAAGNMHGLTITFDLDEDSDNVYSIDDGIVNKYTSKPAGLTSYPSLYQAVSKIIGSEIKLTSRAYKNSEYTIFLRVNTSKDENFDAQENVVVYGQYGGTNLKSSDYKCSIADDRDINEDVNTICKHIAITIVGRAPSCLEDGISDGAYCSLCGITLREQETVPALGHQWQNAICGSPRVCKNCGISDGNVVPHTVVYAGTKDAHTKCSNCNAVISTDHQYEASVQTAATCTTKGTTKYTCECGYSYTAQDIQKIEHQYIWKYPTDEYLASKATCTEKAQYYYRCATCEGKGEETYEFGEELGHGATEIRDAKTATCLAEGYTGDTYCTICNTKIATGTITAKAGHDEKTLEAKKATCTEDGLTEGKKCSVCGEVTVEQTVVPAKGHKEEVLEGKAATCTESGLTEGKKCSVCGTVTTAQTVVPAKGHTPGSAVKENEIAATCTKTGSYDSVIYCSVCNVEISRTAKTVAQLAHTEEKLPAKEATCTTSGLTEGNKCSVCDAIITEQTVIPAKGHTHGAEVKENEVAATCLQAGSYDSVVYCTVCHIELSRAAKSIDKLPHTEVTIAGTAPTCTETGLTEGKQCSVCDTITLAQTVIEAKGHTEEKLPAKEATCTEDGLTEGKKCTICKTVTVAQRTIKAKGHTEGEPQKENVVGAQCGQGGSYESVVCCTVCSVELSRTKIEVPATGDHNYVTESERKEATCTEDGYVVMACSCGATETTEIPAKGHFEIELPAKDATCTETGLTEGVKCTVCDTIITEQTVIPAKGHTVTILPAKAATCTETGLTVGQKCTVCNTITVAQTEIPAKGHTEGAVIKENEVAATCTKTGSYDSVVYCVICKVEISRTAHTVAQLAHTEITLDAKEATCTTTGLTEGKQCSVCGTVTTAQTVIPVKGHTPGSAVKENEVAATCTKTGSYDSVVYCSVCNAEISRTAKTVAQLAHTEEKLPAKEATCTESGLTEGKKCSVCDTIITEQTVIPAKGHKEEDLPAKDATCTESGLTAGKKCSVCGTVTTAQTVIPAKGHTPGSAVKENEVAATCTKTGSYDSVIYCSVCKVEISRSTQTIDKLAHTEEKLPAKEATCTTTGLTEGQKCSVCGTITVKQNVIPAKGHTEEDLPAKEATCTESGLTAGKKCSVCGTITVKQNVIEAKGHTEEKLPAKDATCTESGLTEGKKCSVCGTITIAQTVVPAKGHTEGEPQKENVVGAQCGQGGSYESVVCCTVCNVELSRTKIEVPATGDHNYVIESERKEATCTKAGYVIMACSCGATKTTEIPAKGHTEEKLPAKDATCTETGLTEGTKCSVCGTIIVEQTVIPAKGHTEKTLAAKDATCTETGLEEGKQCTVCGAVTVEQAVIPAKGHTVTRIPAKAATCTETGLTVGQKCTVCNTITVAQTEIPAKGHTAGAVIKENEVAATCTKSGSYDSVIYCVVCDAEISRTTHNVAQLAHTEEKLPAKDATCTETGLTEGKKCSVCGTIIVEQTVIEAKGHTPGSAVKENEVAATCTKTGSYDSVIYCSVCKVEISRSTQTIDKLAHTYDQKDTSDEYLMSAPTINTNAVYYYSCSCGEKGTTTFEVAPKDFTVTEYNRDKVGYTEADDQNLVIPAIFQDKDGTWYKVVAIGALAFDSCDNLTSVTLPNSVTSIGGGAFGSCCELTNITIPNSVTSIGDSAFACCCSLTNITIPDGVKTIGTSAFAACSKLTSITFPNSVTSIGDSAFHGCSKLASITIPASVTTIGTNAFPIPSSSDIPGADGKWHSISTGLGYAPSAIPTGKADTYVAALATPTLAPNSTWFNNSYGITRESITEIFIKDFYKPTGTAGVDYYAWDASEAKDGSVMVYVEGAKLTISGNGYGKVFMNANSSYAFSDSAQSDYFKNVTEIQGTELLDASLATTFLRLFQNCESLVSLDLNTWNTSNITDLSGTFNKCYDLNSLNVAEWDTSKVTAMSAVFQHCQSLNSVDVSKWDTSSVTLMNFMFNNCSSLTNINVSNWDTGKVTNMRTMFAKCFSLTTIDVSNWKTGNVTDMREMFACVGTYGQLQNIDVSKWDTSNVTNMSTMFQDQKNLTTLDTSNWDTSKVTDMGYMFHDCKSLTTLDVSSWNTSNVTNMYQMFTYCKSLSSLDLSSFNTTKVTDMTNMFTGMTNLNTITLGANFSFKGNGSASCVLPTPASGKWYSVTTGTGYAPANVPDKTADTYVTQLATPILAPNSTWFNNDYGITRDSITEIVIANIYKPTGTAGEDYYAWDASEAKDGSVMVYVEGTKLTISGNGYGCVYANADSSYAFSDSGSDRFGNLTKITGGNLLDTSNATTLYRLFYLCKKLETVDVSNWNTAKVTNMNGVFNQAYVLKEAAVENWDTSSVTDMSYMFQLAMGLRTLDLSKWDVSKVESMKAMFQGHQSVGYMGLTSLGDISKWDTSKVTDMSDMFNHCSALSELDVSNWDTSNVTDMSYMFFGCTSLTTLDVSKWDTSKVTNMGGMFWNCGSLSTLDVSNWKTSSVTNMMSMFGCNGSDGKLQSLDISNWDTSNVTTMSMMFQNQKQLSTLDVSNWNTSKVTDMSYIFTNCYGLTKLDVSNWNTSNVTNMYQMFTNCQSLSTLDLSNFNTAKVTNMANMFYGMTSLNTITLGANFSFKGNGSASCVLPTPNPYNIPGANGKWYDVETGVGYTPAEIATFQKAATYVAIPPMPILAPNSTWFNNSYGITRNSITEIFIKDFYKPEGTAGVDYYAWDGSAAKDGSVMVYVEGTKLTISGNGYGKVFMNEDSSYAFSDSAGSDCFTKMTAIEGIEILDTSHVTNMSWMFNCCIALTELNLGNFDTSNVTNMKGMFAGATDYTMKLTSLNISGFNTNNVTNMSVMFQCCVELTSLDLSHFDTSKVTDMRNMFYMCTTLKELDIGSFDTSNVTNMQLMFYCCASLTELDLSHFNTSKVTNMHGMFAGNKVGNTTYVMKLTSLDISSFDTTNVTNMKMMFTYCRYLTELDVSHFNTSNVTNMYGMFYYCRGISNLDLKNFDTSKVTDMSYMFYGCTSLSQLDVSGFDTSEVTNMSYMFYCCVALTELDVSNFDTSKVTNMSWMFAGAHSLGIDMKLKYLNVSNWDTSNVTTMERMFHLSVALEELDVSNWNTGNVKNMVGTFYDCTHLKVLDVSKWNTSNVASMHSMFISCHALQELDLSNWDTSKVATMDQMFANCYSLTTLNVSNWNTSNVISMSQMFSNCTQIKVLDISSFNTNKVSNMTNMFANMYRLHTITLGANFSFTGNGSASCVLPTPNPSYIPGATGLWFNTTTGQGYAPADVPDKTADTYVAVPPMPILAPNSTWFNNDYGITRDSITEIVIVDTYTPTGVKDKDYYAWDASYAQNGNVMVYVEGTKLTIAGNGYGCIYMNEDSSFVFSDSSKAKCFTSLTKIDGTQLLDTSKVTNMSWMFYNCSLLTNLDVSTWDTSYCTDMNYMFCNCKSMNNLNVSDLNTSKVTNMSGMFEGCSALAGLNLSNFDTSNVTDMSSMFNKCNSLTTFSVINFNTSNVTNMRYMFSGCESLTTLDVSGFNTSKVTGMTSMFNNCKNLTSLNVSNFDTSNVTIMSYMFNHCEALTELDVSNWNTSKVTAMAYMFSCCGPIQTLDISNFDTANVSNMEQMFSYCRALSLDVSNFNTAKVANMRGMFLGCSGLTSLDVSNFNTANVTYMDKMFRGCSALTALDLSSFDTSKVTDITEMFAGMHNLNTIKLGANFSFTGDSSTYCVLPTPDSTYIAGATGLWFNTTTGQGYAPDAIPSGEGTYNVFPPTPVSSPGSTWFNNDHGITKDSITQIDIVDLYKPSGDYYAWDASATKNGNVMVYVEGSKLTISGNGHGKILLNANSANMFNGFSNVTTINGADLLDTSQVTTLEGMFNGCSALKTVDVSNMNTENVTNMSDMFRGCSNLTALDVSNFNTSKVTAMGSMFNGCKTLTTLDVSDFDTNNVKLTSGMFKGCTNLNALDVSSFDTSNVTDMSYMFNGCEALTTLDVSNFDTSKITTMQEMFCGCKSLESLDVSDWNMGSVTNVKSLFKGCASLTTLDVSKWNTGNVTSMYHMFSGCSSLTSLDLSNFNTSKVTSMGNMFDSCSSLTTLDLSNFDTSKVQNMGGMFWVCSALTTLDLSNFNTSNVTSMAYMFHRCHNLAILDISNFDTSKVQSMECMFYECTALTELDLSHFNTSKVTNMSLMFNHCRNLTSLDVSSFDTSNVTTMAYMFNYCQALTELDVSNFDTSKVTGMSYMFHTCTKLTNLKMGDFDTSNVTGMKDMFSSSGMTELDLSSFDTSKVTDMTEMFVGMFNLKKVTLGAAFSFTGDGSTSCVLPTPASGFWYSVTDGNGYAPADIPVGVADTYTAVNEYLMPGLYDEDGELLVPWSVLVDTEEGYGMDCEQDYDVNALDEAYSSPSYLLREQLGGSMIVIDNSVKRIGSGAFSYTDLVSVVFEFGSQLDSIGDTAFGRCALLENIELPNSLTSIGDGAFDNCWSLTSIVIPKSVTKIGHGVFRESENLTHVEFENPNGWWYADTDYATSGTTLSAADLSNPTTAAKYLVDDYISYYWFRGEQTITYTDFTVTADNRNMIGYTDATTDLVIPEMFEYDGTWYKVVGVGNEAFANCTGLTSVTIPSSVTKIGQYAFNGCSNLTSAEFENTSNWRVYMSETATIGLVANVTSATDTATLLKTTHAAKYWSCSGNSGGTLPDTPIITPTITFTIDGVTYQAENNMTWDTWVLSAYNTGGFVIALQNGVGSHVEDMNGNKVGTIFSIGNQFIPELSTYTIDKNAAYITNSDSDSGITSPVGPVQFTIDGTTYYADTNMTWTVWVLSTYNTGGFKTQRNIDGKTYVVNLSGNRVGLAITLGTQTTITPVISTNTITNNDTYKTMTSDSGGSSDSTM